MSDKDTNTPDTDRPAMLVKRDAETQTLLGLFVAILSIPVLIGTAWAENYRQVVVNVIAGLVLLGIGVGITIWGRITAKKARQS